MSAIHLEILPEHGLRIWIAHKLLEPRSSQTIGDMMLHTRQELDAMTEDRSLIYRQWASQLRRIESHLGVPGQVVAIETGIVSTGEERETDIG